MFSQTNPEHEHEYLKDPKLKDKDNLKYWDLYLGDPDEYLAHKEEIKFEIRAGLSPDEIIRNKVGGAIRADNYPVALRFKEIVMDSLKEVIEEDSQNEQPA